MKFLMGLFIFAFGVMAIGVYLAFHAPEHLGILFSVLFFGAVVFLVRGVWRAIVKGELPGRSGNRTVREASPIVFWFQIGTYLSVAAFMFFGGLALLGVAPHWFVALLRSMHR